MRKLLFSALLLLAIGAAAWAQPGSSVFTTKLDEVLAGLD